jgi:hypothetical protein
VTIKLKRPLEPKYPPRYEKQIKALESILADGLQVTKNDRVSVYAFDCPWIGGFRIAEIAIHDSRSGQSWQRGETGIGDVLILAGEDFVRTYFDPTRKTADDDPDKLGDVKKRIAAAVAAIRV